MAGFEVSSMENLISTSSENTAGPSTVHKDVSVTPVQNKGARKGPSPNSSQKKKRVFDSTIPKPVNDLRKKIKLDAPNRKGSRAHPKIKRKYINNKPDDPKKSVFIGNLSFAAEEEDLWKLFTDCGPIESVHIVKDNRTAVSKGVAFVNFKSTDAAELALKLDKTKLKKRNIAVSHVNPSAKPSTVKSPYEKRVGHKKKNANDGTGETKEPTEAIEQNEGSLEKPNSEHMEAVTEEAIEESKKHINNGVKNGKTKSKEQTIENAKNKNIKKNKGQLKKKKTPGVLLRGGIQKKKNPKVK